MKEVDIRQCWRSINSDLTFLGLKGHDFIIKGFSKTIKFIRRHFQTRNFNCTATESKFQDKCLFVYLLMAEIFFCLRPTTKRFPFSFQMCRMSRKFCCLFTRSQPENPKFQTPVRAPCLKFWSPKGKSQAPLATGRPLGFSFK